eukprot:gene14318-biopygen10031
MHNHTQYITHDGVVGAEAARAGGALVARRAPRRDGERRLPRRRPRGRGALRRLERGAGVVAGTWRWSCGWSVAQELRHAIGWNRGLQSARSAPAARALRAAL